MARLPPKISRFHRKRLIRRNIEKNLTKSPDLYRLRDSALVLSSTRSSSACERRRKEARDPERAGESTCSGPLSPAAASREGTLMTLRAYQESPSGATCIYLRYRAPADHLRGTETTQGRLVPINNADCPRSALPGHLQMHEDYSLW